MTATEAMASQASLAGEGPTVVERRTPRPARRSSPRNDVLFLRLWWLGLVALWILVSMFGLAWTAGTPVSIEPTSQLGWLQPLLFPERWLGDLAALNSGPWSTGLFWLPMVLVLAVMPAILVGLHVRFAVALSCTALAILTPVLAWQGGAVLQALLPGLVAGGCWMWAVRSRSSALVLVAAIVGGLALARVPWSAPEMALPLSLGLAIIVAVMLLDGPRGAMRLLQVVLISGLTVSALWWAASSVGGASVVAQLLVPGGAPDSGNVGLARAFGAPFDVLLSDGPVRGASGLSDVLAGSWTFLVAGWFVLVLGAVVAGPWGERARTAAVSAVVLAGFAWFLLDSPQWQTTKSAVSVAAPSDQMAAVWGIVVVFAMALVFDAPRHWLLVALAAVASAVLLWATAQSIAAQFLLVPGDTALVVIAASGIVWLLLRRPGWWQGVGMFAAVLAAGATVGAVLGWQVVT